MDKFEAEIEIIGINPYVSVPVAILNRLFKQAGKEKGVIPIKGKVNGKAYRQTLMKYKGAWRLYINTTMLKNSPKRIGEVVTIIVTYDSTDRTIKPHADFEKALKANKQAQKVFDGLTPSRRKEIIRYISFLKTEESRSRNIKRAIGFLSGKERFVGRDKP
jgi:hypothetical protein